MRVGKKGLVLLLAAVTSLLIVQCGGHHDEEETIPLNWLEVARSIDYQLGDISDGTANTCGGNDLATIGDHCKNRLQGTINPELIRELVRIVSDFYTPADLLGLGDINLLFRRGFTPQTAKPCTEDVDANGEADYKQACADPTKISCIGAGNNNYILVYSNCVFNDGGDNWILNGTVGIKTELTAQNEMLVTGSSQSYREKEESSSKSYMVSGNIVRYLVLNPATGAPALGTQRHYPDGMEIISVEVMVDADGDGADEVGPYKLNFANDFEDGLVFFAGYNAMYVWINFSDPNITLDFYDKNLPRNGNELGVDAGCQVQIDINTIANRQFDYTSTGGCLGSETDFSY